MTLADTLGVYIQVPFCASKCSFCNFSSRVERSSAFDTYCNALIQEIDRLRQSYEPAATAVLALPVDTLYMGGGTPSLLGVERLQRILRAIEGRLRVGSSPEFTLEVTPGSADGHFLERVQALGVNRLSIGAQSFDDRELSAIGRLHSADDIRGLVQRARGAGFENVSLDLIAGLPYQTRESWRRSLDRAAGLRPEHMSVYLFEVDEKSRLGREVLRHGHRYHAAAVPDEEFMAEAYETARAFLASTGYAQYEISSFALSGRESRHNRKYWRLEPYVGIGAGAHSFDGACRWANETSVEAYEAKLGGGESPIVEFRALTDSEQIEEFFFLGLRERRGVDLALARRRWGGTRVAIPAERVSTLVREGWLEQSADQVRLSGRALLVSNEVFQQFLT